MKMVNIEDRLRRNVPADPITKPGGEDGGPTKPNVRKPEANELLKRMRQVDPDQAKKYRQRSGE